MIRYLFIFLIFIHGLIHLMGFAKAFGYGRINQITKEIGHITGVFWLAVSLLLMLSSILLWVKNENWIWTAVLATGMSQVLIIMAWHDAKLGTIPNLAILFGLLATILIREVNVIFRD